MTVGEPPRTGSVLLGTIALEPNRWATVDPSGAPSTDLVAWLPAIADAGFDGIELWERHLPSDPDRAVALCTGPVPVTVFNTYVDFDDPDPSRRSAVGSRVASSGASGVKFNVGNDPGAAAAYASRLQAWVDELPAAVVALCECHAGISIAEDPAVAARLFDSVDRPGRVSAIVHTHESVAHLGRRIAAYGPGITHVHVNYLDVATMSVPPLADRIDDLREKTARLAGLGHPLSWTVEFVHGTLTDRDEPGLLLDQAIEDLAVLRSVLDEVFG